MYLSFYSLDKKPFLINTEPRFLWLGEIHKEALSVLKYGVMSRNGVLVLTGDVGTGKTTLINALLSELNSNVTAANIINSSIDLIGFLNLVGQAFHIPKRFDRIEDFIFQFSEFLHKKFYDNCHVLLVVDEAHRLSPEILEQIRLLSNIEMEGQNLISFFLVGQNELNKKLLSRDCRALRQRITIHYQLKPLSESETLQYCNYRLSVAGSQIEIFNQHAIREIYRYSRGNPRLINIICEQALIAGYVKEARKIAPEIIKECSRELRLPGEIKIRLKFDLTGKISSARNSISNLTLRSKIRANYYQFKKNTKLVLVYLFDRLVAGPLYPGLTNSIWIDYSSEGDSARQPEEHNNVNIQFLGNDKNEFLKKYSLKRKIHNFISRLTKTDLGNTTLTVGSLILALIFFLWFQSLLPFESELKLSDSLAMRSKVPNAGAAGEHAALKRDLNVIDTAAIKVPVKKPSVNLELTEPGSIEIYTKLRKNNLFTQIVDPMDQYDDIKPLGPLENNYEISESGLIYEEEKDNLWGIQGTESVKINIIEFRFSTQKFDDKGQQDMARFDSMGGLSKRSRTSYSVQVGAFLFKKNAIKMIGILEKKGYLANIVNFNDAKGRIWYTVRFGAYDSLSFAKKKSEVLSYEENLEAIVRRSDRF